MHEETRDALSLIIMFLALVLNIMIVVLIR
jgi:hypothetical protein